MAQTSASVSRCSHSRRDREAKMSSNLAVHDDPLSGVSGTPMSRPFSLDETRSCRPSASSGDPGPDRACVDADVLVSGAQVGPSRPAGWRLWSGAPRHLHVAPDHRKERQRPIEERGLYVVAGPVSCLPVQARPGCRSGPDRRSRRTRTAGPRRSGRPGARPARPWSRRRRARAGSYPAARAAARPRRTPRSSSRSLTETAGGSCGIRTRAARPRPAASSHEDVGGTDQLEEDVMISLATEVEHDAPLAAVEHRIRDRRFRRGTGPARRLHPDHVRAVVREHARRRRARPPGTMDNPQAGSGPDWRRRVVHAKPPLYAPLAANTYLRTRN